MDVWEVRKQILYDDDACPSHLQSQSLVGDLGVSLELMGRGVDKRDKSDDVNSIHFGANSCVCSCEFGSACGSGCVVDGGVLL